MAYTKKQIIDALDASLGQVYMAADRLGCTHQTILNWIKRSPDVASIQNKWRGKMLDVAEVKLYEKIKNGDNWAIGFTLGKLGHSRGYKDKQEVDHSGNVAMPRTFAEWVKFETERNKK